ncbi:hypothetical protein GN956_G16175 [Arapaima gigas]
MHPCSYLKERGHVVWEVNGAQPERTRSIPPLIWTSRALPYRQPVAGGAGLIGGAPEGAEPCGGQRLPGRTAALSTERPEESGRHRSAGLESVQRENACYRHRT